MDAARHDRTDAGLRRLRRALLRHRRALASLLAGVTVTSALVALRPPPPMQVDVVVAANDLPAGTALRSADLRIVPVPVAYAGPQPEQDPAALVDRVLMAPVLAGEPVTRTRLLGAAPPAGATVAADADHVAAPVRISDPGAVALLSPGDLVDVLAADATGSAQVVARDVVVLAVPRDRSGADGLLSASGDGQTGSLVVLSVSPSGAVALARAAASAHLSVVLHPRR